MLEGRRAKARRGELGKPVPMGYVRRPSGEVALDPDEQAQATIRQVFALFQRFRTVGKVLCYLVEHDIRMPVRTPGGPAKGELEWRRANRPSLHNLFGNPIYAGIYAFGVRATDRRRQKPGRPGTGRRPPRAGEAEVFLPDRVAKRTDATQAVSRFGSRPTSAASSSSAIRCSFAPIARTGPVRHAPAARCCRACWCAVDADCA
jgi:hypothetical protein